MNSSPEVSAPSEGRRRDRKARYLARYYRKHRKHLLSKRRKKYHDNPDPFLADNQRRRGAPGSPERRAWNDYQSERSLARLPNVRAAQRDRFRKDPQLEEKRGIRAFVVCRICGAKLQRLIGGRKGHLLSRHGMTTEQYHANYPGAPIYCLALREAMSRSPGRHQRGREYLGKVRGHDARVDLAPVARGLLIEKKSYRQLAQELNRNISTIHTAAKKLGIRQEAGHRRGRERQAPHAAWELARSAGKAPVEKRKARGLGEDTQRRITLAAACCVLGWSKRRMSSLLFRSSAEPYQETKRLFRRHRAKIEEAQAGLHRFAAESLVSQAQA